MAIVYRDPSGTKFYGFLVQEGVDEFLNFDARAAILDDLGSYIPVGTDILAVCLWKPNTRVVFFDSLVVQGYGGNPFRYKFGTLTKNVVGVNHLQEYVTFDTQTYKAETCIWFPATYAPVPFTTAEIPSTIVASPLLGLSDGAGLSYNVSASGYVGSTGFVLSLQPSVVCDVCVEYFAYWGAITNNPDYPGVVVNF